jgi:hypothetical protein
MWCVPLSQSGRCPFGTLYRLVAEHGSAGAAAPHSSSNNNSVYQQTRLSRFDLLHLSLLHSTLQGVGGVERHARVMARGCALSPEPGGISMAWALAG